MLFKQRWHLELRHLRYFVAVAEARSLKLAAEGRLHTTQPSLSRQIRDLEDEVGTPLFVRGAKGVELTHQGLEDVFQEEYRSNVRGLLAGYSDSGLFTSAISRAGTVTRNDRERPHRQGEGLVGCSPSKKTRGV